jgi:hypothetical protein
VTRARRRRSSRGSFAALLGAVAGLAAVSCGGAATEPSAPKPSVEKGATAGAAPSVPAFLPKRRFVPDLSTAATQSSLYTATGTLKLVGRMRVASRPDGSQERADELLPLGNKPVAVRLPTRLGGGFAFLVNSARGTEIWRSETWLGTLAPLASFSSTPDAEEPLIVGFDRLYVRLKSQNELVAIDPRSGGVLGRGALPIAPAYGDMAFVDAWRAVVDTDMAGTLVTFDAGATWTRIPTKAPSTPGLVRIASVGTSSDDPDDGGEAVVTVDGGYYTLGRTGELSFHSGPTPARLDAEAGRGGLLPGARSTGLDDALRGPPVGPLGRRPLRTALVSGYPDGPDSAVVAHEGGLARVSLVDGRILEHRADAYPEKHMSCTGIALGFTKDPKDRFGFVCGGAGGPTVVYAFERPLALREVMRFQSPRVVTESGQGAIVVRGACNDDPQTDTTVRPFCVRFADGSTREVRVRGDVGAERVVALGDGRVAILVPPRPGTQGQLSLLSGSSSKHIPLKLPAEGAPREIETGMWLEGFHQSAPDELAGWIEAGGPVMGVRVKLDGTVSVGDAVDEPRGVLTSGRFGLAVGEGGRVLETSDTGRTWSELSLPRLEVTSDASRTRRCGAVGCVFSGWLKVGWDEPASDRDLEDAPAPAPSKLSSLKLPGKPLSLSCTVGRTESGAKGGAKKNAGESSSGWLAFRGVDAPPMQKGEVGFDNGAPFDVVPLRVYAWGKKDADWSRTGRFLVRWADRYALDEVRSSAATSSPWASEQPAADALGLGSMGWGVTFSATRDPGLPAALIAACRSGASCGLFGVEQGQPVLPFRSAQTSLPLPIAGSAVRVGQSWFFLGNPVVPTPGRDRVGLYRADLGNVRLVHLFDRPPAARFNQGAVPKLVRRVESDALGLLFTSRDGPLDRRGARYVLPVDLDTGEPGEPIRLGRPDFGDVVVSAGCERRDGWLVELPANDPSPDVKIGGVSAPFEGGELRMRLDPGVACLDGGSATTTLLSGQGGGGQASGPGFRVIATDRGEGTRRELICRVP